MNWKPDWPEVKERYARWWRREGLVVYLTAPREVPIEPAEHPGPPRDWPTRWTDPRYVCDLAEHRMARTFYAADAFPYLCVNLGPGSLGTFLGVRPCFEEGTTWYEPCIEDPDTFGAIRFEPAGNHWLDVHMAVIDEAVRRSGGRYLVSMPDLVENLDTLAALRGSEQVLADLLDRPAWVRQKLDEINEAFFAAFDLIRGRIVDGDGGNAFVFSIWGPGRTAKVQCDISCMISPKMFREFVAPPLAAQCEWLDYSLYHLDGDDALGHLDALLEIESLDAIEWTPVGSSTPNPDSPTGGSPHWYDLYRRIKAAGKGVQAMGVTADEVVPLIEAVGPEGLYVSARAPDQKAAEKLAERVSQYR